MNGLNKAKKKGKQKKKRNIYDRQIEHHSGRDYSYTIIRGEKTVQQWVDDRFGVPNNFNTQLLLDFEDFLVDGENKEHNSRMRNG